MHVLARDVTLAGLRTEVVRVSRSTGAYVRTRRVHSSDRWKSLHKKVGVLHRLAQDASALDIGLITRARPRAQLGQMVVSLREVQEKLASLLSRLEEAVK